MWEVYVSIWRSWENSDGLGQLVQTRCSWGTHGGTWRDRLLKGEMRGLEGSSKGCWATTSTPACPLPFLRENGTHSEKEEEVWCARKVRSRAEREQEGMRWNLCPQPPSFPVVCSIPGDVWGQEDFTGACSGWMLDSTVVTLQAIRSSCLCGFKQYLLNKS